MQAIACDGDVTIGVGNEILCDGTLVLIEPAFYMDEELAFGFMAGATVLFAIAFGIRLIRRVIYAKT